MLSLLIHFRQVKDTEKSKNQYQRRKTYFNLDQTTQMSFPKRNETVRLTVLLQERYFPVL